MPLKKAQHEDRMKDARLEVRLPGSLMAEVDKAAARAGCDRSEWVRLVCTIATGQCDNLTEATRLWGAYHARRKARKSA